MPLRGRAGRARAGTCYSALALLLLTAALAIPATAAATPSANFTISPSSPQQGQAVTFKSTGNCDRAPCTYRWYHPEEFATSANQPRTTAQFTYTGSPGPRTVRLVVRNARGQSVSRSQTFTLRAASAPPPDGDGDGVRDSSDQCPTQAGPASNNGCPVPPGPPPPPSPPPPSPPPPSPPPPSSGKNCMPTPSGCGFPDMTNTGALPGVARTAVSGTVTLSTPGQVYENKTVTGSIVVTASNVTIRNVKVFSTAYWAISSRSQNGNPTNLQIQDTEIDMQGNEDAYGIIEDNYTAVRTLIHNGSDCAHLGVNATIRDSFCSVGPDTNNDGWADSTGFCKQNAPGSSSPPHFDGYSSDGGANQVYDHNTIRNPCSQTSAILESTNSGAISNVKITNNLMAGGGYTLYCAATSGGVGGNETVTGNRIAKTFWATGSGDGTAGGGYYGPVAYCNTADTFSGNVWDDTGVSIGQ